MIRLPAGQTLPHFITQLTGITDEQLRDEGVDDRTAAEGFCRLLDGAEQPLLVAYNAQFDLNFLYYLLRPLGLLSVLQKPRFLDALTVYRDRRDFPHKLCNAIEAYGLTGVENSHGRWMTPAPQRCCWKPWRRKRMICCNMWISSACIPSTA